MFGQEAPNLELSHEEAMASISVQMYFWDPSTMVFRKSRENMNPSPGPPGPTIQNWSLVPIPCEQMTCDRILRKKSNKISPKWSQLSFLWTGTSQFIEFISFTRVHRCLRSAFSVFSCQEVLSIRSFETQKKHPILKWIADWIKLLNESLQLEKAATWKSPRTLSEEGKQCESLQTFSTLDASELDWQIIVSANNLLPKETAWWHAIKWFGETKTFRRRDSPSLRHDGFFQQKERHGGWRKNSGLEKQRSNVRDSSEWKGWLLRCWCSEGYKHFKFRFAWCDGVFFT